MPNLHVTAAALAAVALGFGVPSAHAAFTPGTYAQGDAAHSGDLHRYASVRFAPSGFDVERIALPLRCRSPEGTSRSEFSFGRRAGVRFTGVMGARGGFAGVYREVGAKVAIRGKVRGDRARMRVRFVVDLGVGSTDRSAPVCKATHTFRLRRTAG